MTFVVTITRLNETRRIVVHNASSALDALQRIDERWYKVATMSKVEVVSVDGTDGQP